MTLRSLFTMNLRACTIGAKYRLSEWHMTGVMTMAGLVLLSSHDTFTLPPYAVVSQLASQTTWGVVMTGTGVVRSAVLFINGSWSRSPHLRAVLAAMSAIIWSIMLAGFLAFSIPLQIGPFLFWAVIVDLINAFRAAQDARAEDENGAVNGTIR